MSCYQFILAFLCGFLFILGSFFLLKTLLIYKSFTRHSYFSGLSFGGLSYCLFQLLLTCSHFSEHVVLFHRLKLFSAGVAFFFFLLCIDDLFSSNKKLSFSYLIFFLMCGVFFFSPYFIDNPVRVLNLGRNVWSMNLSAGTVGPAYWVFALGILFFVTLCSIRFLFSSLSFKTKLYAALLAFPVLIGAANDFAVVKGIYENIFLTELNVFVFISGMFFNFLAQEQKDSKNLKRLNSQLEHEVAERTRELYQVNEALKDRHFQLVKDLEIARRLQLSFIPRDQRLPKLPELHVAGRYESVEHVGGDLYDVMELAPGVYGFLMADVSGHGVPAAMVTTMVKLSFNSHASPHLEPGEVCRRVNEELLETLGDLQHYLTAFFGVLNLSTGRFQYACAGHMPPMLFRHHSKTCEKIKARGMFIGVFKNAHYETLSTELKPGDRLLIFTDGVIESRHPEKPLFSYDLLERFLEESHEIPVHSALDRLMEELALFREKTPAKDDQAVLFLEYQPLSFNEGPFFSSAG